MAERRAALRSVAAAVHPRSGRPDSGQCPRTANARRGPQHTRLARQHRRRRSLRATTSMTTRPCRRRPLLRRRAGGRVSTATAKRPANSGNLDNLTLSRKEGWRDYVEPRQSESSQRRCRRAQIRRLSDAAADIYNQRRADWHNNIGPLRTPAASDTARGPLGHHGQQHSGREPRQRRCRPRRLPGFRQDRGGGGLRQGVPPPRATPPWRVH